MKQIFFLLIIFAVITSCHKESQIQHPEAGVPLTLAEARKENISDIFYDLTFKVPREKSEDIEGIINITFALEDQKDVFIDFKEETDHIQSVVVNDQNLTVEHQNEHIRIPAEKLERVNRVKIAFIAGNLSLNRNDDYLYTLLVPDRARTVFPVIDQPNLKATYILNLTIPEDWEAVANAPEEHMTITDRIKTINYQTTQPIPTYLFAFAAGKFQKMTNEAGDMTMYYRESDQKKVNRNAPEIFRLHREALDWLEEYTGIPYPFQKFDFALIPTFQYGGMEHPGSIFYRESSLMLGESPSINQQLRRASLIAHETAHMWFGDLVTMDWFNDVWLKEVFANFMAAKIVNPSFPEVNHDLRFLLSHYPRAYEIDRSEGSHPIQQPLDNLQNAGSLYGAIIYQKAPIVMRNLETIVGEERFREGLQEYLTTYAYDNATWDDLIAIMNKRTETDLEKWNQDWVKSAGMPNIDISVANGQADYRVTNTAGGQVWPQKITSMSGTEQEVPFQLNGNYSHPSSTELFPNADGVAYGYFKLKKEQLDFLFPSVKNEDEMVRASGWLMLWEAFLHGQLDVSAFYVRLLQAIEKEENPLIMDYLTGRVETIYWNFMKPQQQSSFINNTERLLYAGMMNAKDISLRRNYYDAYISIASTPSALQTLEAILSDELVGFELPLSENDYISLACQLAIREVAEADNILSTQLEKIENPDNRKRLQFLLPALSEKAEKRDSFFNSLLLSENREQEPWVSQALQYLHHPLRAQQALTYITPSLEIIEEIKATGDIFFPKAWLDATLGGHSSVEAAEKVRTFLDSHPDLPQDLRKKVLQSTDILYRTSEIKG